MSSIDLFLSYHRPDSQQVATIRRYLNAQGLQTFFDSQDIATGQPWPQELERALASARAMAVFLGPHGMGKWQKREMWFALDRQASEESTENPFPVVPILLPDAELIQTFLFMNTWVDLRRDPSDPQELARLVRLVRDREQAAAAEMPCPFRGLRAFREEDAGLFFGREAVTDELFETVRDGKTVLLVGPSGSGKSSVIHAGLIPLLRKQRPPRQTWDMMSFTPGDRPFHRFAAVAIPLLDPDLNTVQKMAQSRQLGDELARGNVLVEDVIEQILIASGGTDRLLVVVDQFEELFTLNRPEPRDRFIEAFLSA